MRNLKKILALVLALVMSMSLVSIASATKFSDDADIEHQEAVEVMTALEIIDGVGNNTFNPNGNVTRAQMAKMITIISLGNVDASAFLGTATDLTDIDGHWAEAFIKYCYSQGIIAGKGNGIFSPNANVTTAEAAKMLLVAIGYNSDVQVYEGANWKINVIRDAQTSKFFEELSVTADQALTRDQAAQMIYNAIDATMIERTSTVDRTDGTISDHYGPYADGRDLLSETFEVQRWVGTLTGNYYTGASLSSQKGMITVTGKLSTADESVRPTAAGFYSDMPIDYIGEQVEVLFKDENGGTKNKPDSKDTIYGVYVTGATQVITGILADVKDQKSNDAKLDIGGTKYDTEDSVSVTVNYNTTNSYSAINGSSSANSSLTNALKASNGDTLKAVTDADTGEIEAIYVTKSKIAAVTAINSEKISMNNGVGTIVIADNEVYDNAAKGDVVVVTTLYEDNAYDDGAYTIVELAEVVSGTVTGYKDAESVTVDGTVYKIYNKAAMLSAIPDQTVTTTFNGNDDAIGENFDLYLVNGYVGAAVQTSESANNYSLVLDVKAGTAGSAFNALQLQVLNAEGTTEIITVSDDSAKTNSSDYTKGDIIVYTGDASDAVVTIKSEYVASTSGSYSDSTKTFAGHVTAANCVLFAETTANALGTSGAKYKVYSIRSLDSFTCANTNYVTDDNGRVVAVFADLGSTPAGATSNTVYGIVSAANGRVKIDDDYYYQYTVSSNSETYTLNLSANNIVAKGDLVSFEPVNDNVYSSTDVDKITSGAVYVKEYSEGDNTLTYYTAITLSDGSYVGVSSTQTTLALDEDCTIVYVNADDDAAGSEIGVNAFDSVTGYKNAAIVTKVVDGANVVQAIFVETSNECNILGTTPPSGNTTAGGEGELTLNDTLPATDATITPTASNVPTLDGDSIDTVNGGLFNGFDASALSGKKFTTLTVTIPVEGKFAIRQTNAALAGSATDGRVNGNIKIAGYENAGSETEIELSVVVMEGGGDIILEVISNATGTYGNVYADNMTAFNSDGGQAQMYTIKTTGITFA